MSKKQIIILSTVIAILILGGVAYGSYKWRSENKRVACTMEAKLCPNGSSVGRTGPNCEFAECDSVFVSPSATTEDWWTYKNEQYGFEFNVPSGDAATSVTSSNGVSYSDSGQGEKWFWSVDVKANTSNQTLQQVFDENYNRLKADAMAGSDFKLKDFFISDIKVGGKNAKELYIDNFGDVGSTMVSVVNNGYVYMISGGLKKGDLDQFLSTFKFTK